MQATYKFTLTLPEWGIPFLAEAEWPKPRPGIRHNHNEVQVLLMLDGIMDIDFGNARHELPAGVVCVVPNQVYHAVTQRPGITVNFIDLRILPDPASPMIRFLKQLPNTTIHTAKVARLRRCVADLRAAVEGRGSEKTGRVMGCIWQMLAETAAGAETDSAEPGHSGEADRRLALAEEFMRDKLSHAIDVETVAQAVRLSRSQLTRLYERHLKTSPSERLRQLRIEKARELLNVSTLSIKEVAHACGFVCPNHFSRVYRQVTGEPPSNLMKSRGTTISATQR